MPLTLTSLPPEIRRAIFEHALRPTTDNDIRTVDCLNLLAASKQIYHETCLLPLQTNTIALPAITDSSTTATLKFLRRLSTGQLNAVRTLHLQFVGSTFDAVDAAKVLRRLRLTHDDCDTVLDSAAQPLPAYTGDLRELTMTISSRDISIPLADCRVGLQKSLVVEKSPFFGWITTFDSLRAFSLRVRVLRDDQFPEQNRAELQSALRSLLKTPIQLHVVVDTAQRPDHFVDELDFLYPDSYIGVLGNICVVPMEFQHAYK